MCGMASFICIFGLLEEPSFSQWAGKEGKPRQGPQCKEKGGFVEGGLRVLPAGGGGMKVRWQS